MALSRFILNNFTHGQRSPLKSHPWSSQLIHHFSSSSATTDHHEKPDAKEISVSNSTNKPKLFSPRRRRHRSLWSGNNDRNIFPPSLSGVGNAILEAATNMNRLLESLSPWNPIRRVKEKNESYKIEYQMPGLSKDDVKITVEDDMLFIRGEHKEEKESEGSDDGEYWSASASYGYYNTSLRLPEDAKVEEIKAEMKDGVLHVSIPKDETKKKQMKEVQVA